MRQNVPPKRNLQNHRSKRRKLPKKIPPLIPTQMKARIRNPILRDRTRTKTNQTQLSTNLILMRKNQLLRSLDRIPILSLEAILQILKITTNRLQVSLLMIIYQSLVMSHSTFLEPTPSQFRLTPWQNFFPYLVGSYIRGGQQHPRWAATFAVGSSFRGGQRHLRWAATLFARH